MQTLSTHFDKLNTFVQLPWSPFLVPKNDMSTQYVLLAHKCNYSLYGKINGRNITRTLLTGEHVKLLRLCSSCTDNTVQAVHVCAHVHLHVDLAFKSQQSEKSRQNKLISTK